MWNTCSCAPWTSCRVTIFLRSHSLETNLVTQLSKDIKFAGSYTNKYIKKLIFDKLLVIWSKEPTFRLFANLEKQSMTIILSVVYSWKNQQIWSANYQRALNSLDLVPTIRFKRCFFREWRLFNQKSQFFVLFLWAWKTINQ